MSDTGFESIWFPGANALHPSQESYRSLGIVHLRQPEARAGA